ncbi:hypothetical protein [Enterococcus faecalis]|uniref:hypothetical protein n=1 Tax=Enterococcus faecalis TaxID=1351 RepID=UPI00404280FA
MEKRNLQLQLETQKDRVQELKKKERETELLFQDLRNSYQRQSEILHEILYLSKGTTAEPSAFAEIEELEYEQKQLTQVFEDGKEELTFIKKKEQQVQEELEGTLEELKRQEKEDSEHAKN